MERFTEVRRSVATLSLDDCTVLEMIGTLQSFQNLFEQELSIEYWGNGYDGYDSLEIYYYSEETDAEYENRLLLLRNKEIKEMNRLMSYIHRCESNEDRLNELMKKYCTDEE